MALGLKEPSLSQSLRSAMSSLSPPRGAPDHTWPLFISCLITKTCKLLASPQPLLDVLDLSNYAHSVFMSMQTLALLSLRPNSGRHLQCLLLAAQQHSLLLSNTPIYWKDRAENPL